MSSAPPPAPMQPPPPASAEFKIPSQIHLYGHSSLFYWWPVWVLGFIFSIWSVFENTRFLPVPGKTDIIEQSASTYELKHDRLSDTLHRFSDKESPQMRRKPSFISLDARIGAIYCVVLLLVIGITNVPLRGLWSVVVIVTIILVAVIIALIPDAWDKIFEAIGGLHIYIGMAGYLFISIVLFLMWCVSMFVFDRQIYIIFEPGQMKVCEEVGAGEKAYDTQGMSIEKQRSDMFRHWVLGLGSGDLTVLTSGATPHQITLNNVLFISKKLQMIEAMQREKQVVS
jgi:hypothetical protein